MVFFGNKISLGLYDLISALDAIARWDALFYTFNVKISFYVRAECSDPFESVLI